MTLLKAGWSVVSGVAVNPLQYSAFAYGVMQGMSANSIIKSLAGTELAIRRTVGLQITRELKGGLQSGSLYKSIGKEKALSIDKVQVSDRIMRDRFKYWGKISYIDPVSGQRETVATSWYADRNLTAREVESELARHQSLVEEQYKWGNVEAEVTAVYRRKD